MISKILKQTLWFLQNREKFSKIILISAPNSHVVPFMLLSNKKIEKIYFPYDIIALFPKLIHQIPERLIEKLNFLLCDKIIHTGLKNELGLLSYNNRINKKPRHLFREFMSQDDALERKKYIKLSDNTGEPHIVYGGGWYYKKNPLAENFFELYAPIYKNKIHFHVYINKVTQEQRRIFKQYESKFDYFHFEGSLKRDSLIKAYTKYDYAINLYISDFNKNNNFVKTAFSNKNFDYIAARIPSLTIDVNEAMAQFITTNGTGMVLDSKKLYSENFDFAELKNNLLDKKSINKFENNINRFIAQNNHKKIINFVAR